VLLPVAGAASGAVARLLRTAQLPPLQGALVTGPAAAVDVPSPVSLTRYKWIFRGEPYRLSPRLLVDGVSGLPPIGRAGCGPGCCGGAGPQAAADLRPTGLAPCSRAGCCGGGGGGDR